MIDGRVHQLGEIILPHLADETFGRAQLGQALYMGRTKLFRYVKRIADLSPGRFIQQYRLSQAKKLLETTRYPIAEIAYRVGFNDPDYFSRAFRKWYGTPPGTVRKAMQGRIINE